MVQYVIRQISQDQCAIQTDTFKSARQKQVQNQTMSNRSVCLLQAICIVELFVQSLTYYRLLLLKLQNSTKGSYENRKGENDAVSCKTGPASTDMSLKYVFSTIPNVLKKPSCCFYSHAFFVAETTTDESEWK